MVVTAMADRTVYRLEKDGTRTMLADRYEGKRFNGPNDIVIKSNGAVYFTDTVWGLRGAANDPAREIPFSGFFLIKDGKVDAARRRSRHARRGHPTASRCRRTRSISMSPPASSARCATTSCPTTRWPTAACS